MTKIYEALEEASKERAQSMPAMAPAAFGAGLPKGLEEKLLSLNRRLETMLERETGVIVAFAGAQPGDDGTRITRHYASIIATRLRRKVLLLACSPQSYLGRGAATWEDALRDGTPLNDTIHAVGDTSLYVAQLCASDLSLPAMLATPRLRHVFEEYREHFDQIVIDTPPAGQSSGTVQLSPLADGVVLVVLAGKTRWQAIRHEMDLIQSQKGKVLGIILNRQRFYIPNFIYRKL